MDFAKKKTADRSRQFSRLSMGYKKDGFAILIDGFEPSCFNQPLSCLLKYLFNLCDFQNFTH